jgi:predicted dehydrogenase
MDGGVLTNQASHHVDLLEWMMGEVDSVYAMATTRLADIETEDTAVVTLKFRNGALGIIEATTAARPTNIEGSVSVLGERGTVVVGGIAVNRMDTWVFEDKRDEDAVVLSEFSENPPDVYGFGHKAYYAHVVQCIADGGPNLVDGMAGRKSLELISAIYESIETGQEVRLRFAPRRCKLGLR